MEIMPRLALQRELHRWLMPVVVLLFGMGWTGAASASSLPPSASLTPKSTPTIAIADRNAVRPRAAVVVVARGFVRLLPHGSPSQLELI